MRKILFLVCVVGLVSCTAAERQDTVSDLGAYVGAPAHADGSIDKDAAGAPRFDGKPDYDPEEVAVAAASKGIAVTSTGGPIGTLYWVLGGAAVVGLGWFKRKFLVEKAAVAVSVLVSKVNPPSDGTNGPV